MTSAQLEIEPRPESLGLPDGTALDALTPPFALQQQAAERLAAHRSRRGRQASVLAAASTRPPEPARAPARSARIAAAVAERYAHSQSYRAFLAEEAERATRQAEAAAEVAHRNARAVAHAQQQLLAELDHWDSAPDSIVIPANLNEASSRFASHLEEEGFEPATASPRRLQIPTQPATALAQVCPTGFTVRLYEDLGRDFMPAPQPNRPSPPREVPIDSEEALALDQEIAFRHAPVFEEPAEPPVPLPANLIEFPRLLVAARKARPRLAEGPLRDEADLAPTSAQLRIFEVQAVQISTTPNIDSAISEWSSIRLDAPALTAHTVVPETLFSRALQPQSAPLSVRFLAAVVDVSIVAAASLGFAGAFAYTAERLAGDQVPMRIILVALGMALPLFALLFFLLFFSFAEATPGMRFARIGLCTFSDENPTRNAMRRRLFAIFIAACPLGIGLLWAWLDDDRLGWHDRISRMYQRSY